ncbi:MAG: serine--tRNA ligase [Clostridia bacterium]|nr:serine--tRNA ligase [Clostridia bacterium]
MLDINLIRENPKKVHDSLLKKGWNVNFEKLLKNDNEKKELVLQADKLKEERNKLSSTVPLVKKVGGNIQAIFDKVKEINLQIEALDEKIKIYENEIFDFMSALPNTPDDDLLAGEKENNKAIYTYGNAPKFDFKPLDHMELCEKCGLVDYERAAKISGRGTCIYTGLGAQLEWALLNFFISEHIHDGYQFILPPHILNYESGYTAGQFPKFKEDVFWLEKSEPSKFMLPTAETALVNFHRNEILSEDELPKKMFAYTPCYRFEAGSYRTEERGMIRGFQFNKVEMFCYATEKNARVCFEELVRKAQSLLEKLGLHFQTSKLAAGDCSHGMARTYDIEIWIPSMNIYKEVSSVSNANDYQARRGNIKYRDKESGKTKYCHTLNGSGLATSRLMPALVEQNQNADGSINIPKVLQPFMGGIEKIYPIKK